jgi:hypothetical protein
MTRSHERGDKVDDGTVDDGMTEVVTEDEVVHVPPGVAELAEAVQHHGETFVADVPDWDEPDSPPRHT